MSAERRVDAALADLRTEKKASIGYFARLNQEDLPQHPKWVLPRIVNSNGDVNTRSVFMTLHGGEHTLASVKLPRKGRRYSYIGWASCTLSAGGASIGHILISDPVATLLKIAACYDCKGQPSAGRDLGFIAVRSLAAATR